ncbi:MAG: hypothetical protein GC168_00050, partial [Candidatus Hydrogenedens sp.]|nr:hypothetical protein [Candidatus Hydrogenedens sp.]
MLALTALPAAAELGVDWEVASNDHPFGGRQHVGLVEFKGKLYAGGGSKCGANDFFCQSGAYYGDLWVSEDGISWTKLWGEGPLFDQYDPAVAPAAQLVAFRDHLYYFGLARGALRSTDGIHWEELDVETRPGYYPVVEYQDSLQVFAGGDSAYSFDGLNWECCRFVGSPNWLPQMTVASLKGVLYVFGSVLNTPHVWRTEDLENWTELTGGNVDELEVFST